MNSCLYECHVMHARFTPRQHRFLYRIFLFGFDLDELETLPRKLALFSIDRFNIFSFRDRDFLPNDETLHNPDRSGDTTKSLATSETPARLKARVIAHLANHGIDLTGGRVMLLTMPRVFGYGFSPVSFYFCYDRSGTVVASLAEVTNTFREIKPYFLGPETRSSHSSEFRLRTPKHFYVSPYSDVDVAFDFKLRTPDDRLSVQIDDYVGSERTLTSTLAGPRRELSNARLAWFTLKYPLLTLRVIGLIHWHALLLWLKKVPWFSKAARAPDQRSLYRPHHSVANSSSPPARPESSALPGQRLGDGSPSPSAP